VLLAAAAACLGHVPQQAKASPLCHPRLAGMTVEHKVGQLNLLTPGDEERTGPTINRGIEEKIRQGQVGGLFGITSSERIRRYQELAVYHSPYGMPLLFGADIIHGYKMPTFPIPLGMSCSGDFDLIRECARIAAEQAAVDGVNWNFNPVIDVCRDPRHGRIMEGAGEDPWFVSKVAEAIVCGTQGGDLADPDRILACLKHFIGTGFPRGGRDYERVDVSPDTLHNVLLPPWRRAIQAGAVCVMAALNDLNGEPCHCNADLLTTLLRGGLGLKGIVVADYDGVREIKAHGIGDDQSAAVRALKAGVDMDMASEAFSGHLQQALAAGRISEVDIDNAAGRVLKVKEMLGLFADPFARMAQERRSIVTAKSASYRETAREAAAKSIVLLKNDDALLPLKKTSSLAVIGPLADAPEEMSGNWAPTADGTKCVSILQGLKNAVPNGAFFHARGANIFDDLKYAERAGCAASFDLRPAEDMFSEAAEAIWKADMVLLVLGESKGAGGEHSSRTDLRIPGRQTALAKMALATGKPVILIVVSGRPNVLTWEDRHISSILWMPFGGTEAGNGAADVLYGDYNPSAKTTITFLRDTGQVPIYYAQGPSGRPLNPEKTLDLTSYVDCPSSPLYGFMHGLSYTSFSYGPVLLSKTRLVYGETLKVAVEVTNTGTVTGEEIAQLYVRHRESSRVRPIEMKGLEKQNLHPGEKKEFSFVLCAEDLLTSLAKNHTDAELVFEGGDIDILVGPNPREVRTANVRWDRPPILGL